MQKILKILLALTFSRCVHAAGMAEIVKNVKEVCLTPSEQGKFWNVTATGGAKADGSIKLIAAGINGQATFTKGEWDGVQQVLKEHQATENADYRDCVEKLTPLFIGKFTAPAPVPAAKTPPKPVAKSTAKASTANPKPATTTQPTTPPPTPAATSPAKPATPESDGDSNTQTIGSQSAEKIINATEINGNIDMGN